MHSQGADRRVRQRLRQISKILGGRSRFQISKRDGDKIKKLAKRNLKDAPSVLSPGLRNKISLN